MKIKRIKRSKGNCPICFEQNSEMENTLVESKWEDSGNKCYICKNCGRIFDYNEFTPCCGQPGTMIETKTIDNSSRDVILKYYCLKCKKQYAEKILPAPKESYISET